MKKISCELGKVIKTLNHQIQNVLRAAGICSFFLLIADSAQAAEKAPQTCVNTGCHQQVKAGEVLHNPVKKDCQTCHKSGANTKLPAGHAPIAPIKRTEVNKLCLGCHEDQVEGKVVHGAIEENSCVSCHSPHSSKNHALLVKPYPEKSYLAFDENEYKLCLKCHETEKIAQKAVTEETEFRNGTVNLHYVHVVGPKGRTCRNCHEVHAAPNPKLIKDNFSFLGLEIPLQFKATKTGGSCTTSCHGVKAYDRQKEVKNASGR